MLTEADRQFPLAAAPAVDTESWRLHAADATYTKSLGTGPTGTYTLDSLCCDGVTAAFPATITVS